MKKFKLICSAIVAFTVLALAGCDLEISDSEKVDIIPGFIMKGTAKVNDGVGDMSFYFYPMYGTWTVNASLNSVKYDAETIESTDAWWGGVHSTHIEIADGDTLQPQKQAPFSHLSLKEMMGQTTSQLTQMMEMRGELQHFPIKRIYQRVLKKGRLISLLLQELVVHIAIL